MYVRRPKNLIIVVSCNRRIIIIIIVLQIGGLLMQICSTERTFTTTRKLANLSQLALVAILLFCRVLSACSCFFRCPPRNRINSPGMHGINCITSCQACRDARCFGFRPPYSVRFTQALTFPAGYIKTGLPSSLTGIHNNNALQIYLQAPA